MPAARTLPAGRFQAMACRNAGCAGGLAAALAAAAEEAERKGLRLVVHECYRPHRATEAFVVDVEIS
ncbi:MAG: hypothetical protein ACLPTZ_25720 [Beijerinckiaceae bacterium]